MPWIPSLQNRLYQQYTRTESVPSLSVQLREFHTLNTAVNGPRSSRTSSTPGSSSPAPFLTSNTRHSFCLTLNVMHVNFVQMESRSVRSCRASSARRPTRERYSAVVSSCGPAFPLLRAVHGIH